MGSIFAGLDEKRKFQKIFEKIFDFVFKLQISYETYETVNFVFPAINQYRSDAAMDYPF